MLNNNVRRSTNNKKVDSSQVSNTQFSESQSQKLNNINNKNLAPENKNQKPGGNFPSSEVAGNTGNGTNGAGNGSNHVSVSNNRIAERMRIFVALFDYDPPNMSPNPDACDEELPFREGQLIKVFGEKDADGFYWGEAGTRSGFVPCNMVSEVQVMMMMCVM